MASSYSSLPEVLTSSRLHNLEVADTNHRKAVETSLRESQGMEFAGRGESQGLEVAGLGEKESARPPAYGSPNDFQYSSPQLDFSPKQDDASKKSWRRKPCLIICAIAIGLLLAIALGVGLGVGLTSGQTTSSDNADQTDESNDSSIDGSIDTNDAFLSTTGAFNGTAVAILPSGGSENPLGSNGGYNESIMVFFQHHTGSIRWMQRTSFDSWMGGSTDEIVATDAKNGTPIAAMNSRPDGAVQWHIFYVDTNNMLRQRTIDNLSYTWAPGLLNKQNVEMFDDSRAALRACFYSGPIDGIDTNDTTGLAGIRLFAATSETTFDQFAWRSGLSDWKWEQSWEDVNGHATPTCYGWQPGSVFYVMFVNLQNAVNVYWRDAATGKSSTDSHPINSWRNSSISIPNVDPAAGIAWHRYLYTKLAGRDIIQGWNLTLKAENSTSYAPYALSTVGGKVPSATTRLDTHGFPGADESLVVYQSEGNDLTMSNGDTESGTWSESNLQIPDI